MHLPASAMPCVVQASMQAMLQCAVFSQSQNATCGLARLQVDSGAGPSSGKEVKEGTKKKQHKHADDEVRTVQRCGLGGSSGLSMWSSARLLSSGLTLSVG